MLASLKSVMSGSGLESFLPDSGLSQRQCHKCSTFEHARRNRRFFMQLTLTTVIKLCDNVVMEDTLIRYKWDEPERLRLGHHLESLLEERNLILSSVGSEIEIIFQIECIFQSRFNELE